MHQKLATVIGILILMVFALIHLPATIKAQDIDDIDTQSCVPDPDEPAPLLFGGARPTSLVLEDAPLLSQPPLTADTNPLTLIEIPAGARVIVFDLDDQTKSYFRVIWPCEGFNFTGWIYSESVRHQVRRTNPKPAPPGCAVALQIVDLLDDVWVSDIEGKIAIVVDLYRAQGGEVYPRSFYYLTRNGRELRDRERVFTSSGPFLINGVVMSADVQVGTRIGFSVITSSKEELNFFGTLYLVPEGCEFVE
jgi:hypothetical protein